MHFPFRLGAALARARLLSIPPILRFSPLVRHKAGGNHFDQDATESESEWLSAQESVRVASASRSSILWTGGEDPLLHPEIGRVATALVDSGLHVFVHTNGLNLRKRVHEFQPSSRLYFAIEFAGGEAAHDLWHGLPGAFARSIESIRTVKLSGFHVCAHISVRPATNVPDICELMEFLGAQDIEGLIVSPGSAGAAPELTATVARVRDLIPSKPWQRFSRLLESAHELEREATNPANAISAAAATSAERA